MADIDREELRALIRAALKEALGGPSPPRGERAAGPEPAKDRPGEGSSGRRHETPLPQPAARATPSPQGGGGDARRGSPTISAGVLTESKLTEIARSHTKIIVAPGVVVTPLARDRARELKVAIERQKP